MVLSAQFRHLRVEMTVVRGNKRNLISSDAFSEAVPPVNRYRSWEVKVTPLAVLVIFAVYRAVFHMMWPQQLCPLLNLIGHSTPHDVATGADRQI
jgi:hypothetical protein